MSMGIACLPDHGATPAELLRNADIALYNAKRLGRDRYEFFTPALLDTTTRRISVQDQAREGLRDGQFCLHYQPVVSLADESLSYLMSRSPRDMPTLLALVDALDRYSLERKRPVTLALLRDLLSGSAGCRERAR